MTADKTITETNMTQEVTEQMLDYKFDKKAELAKIRAEQKRKRALSLLGLAREKLAEREKQGSVPVELQVIDIPHARSAEVLSFCLTHLGSGGTWSSLRHKLGLATNDIRWRLIRERAVEGLLPVDEDSAIKAVGSQRVFLVQKLENMLESLEARMELFTGRQKTFAVDRDYWKLKTEIMKLLLEENSKNLMDHLEMKRAKAADKQQHGVSIIVQNQYYIPRPGDSKDMIHDVVPLINELTEETRKIEALLVNSEELQTDQESP